MKRRIFLKLLTPIILLQVFVLAGLAFAFTSFYPKTENKMDKTPGKLIAIEEHFIIPGINARVMQYLTEENGGVSPISEAQKELIKMVLPDNSIAEVGEQRIAFMDKAGISMQVLSYGASGPQNLTDVDVAVSLCREANNELARLINQHPTRFAGFALLPMADTDEAVKELTRCVNELGFKGAMISGTFNGVFFDDERFHPLFAKAQELNVPLYMHPAVIAPNVADYYYKSNQWSEVASLMFASAGFGWHADSGIALIRMIISGLFDKYPNLQIISGHWGELVPFYLNRLDDQQAKTLQLKHSFSYYFKHNIYITPSGFFNENQLQYCVNEIGADRIIYSADYPFLKDENARLFLENSSISEEDKEKIAFKNAEKLLRF